MKKNRPLVALDLDGTLVSCREKQIDALRKSVAVFKINYCEYERFWLLKREGETTVQALCSTGIEDEIAKEISKMWVELVETLECVRNDIVLPNVLETLKELISYADLMVLSARRDNNLFLQQLHALGLISYFKHYETVPPGSKVSDSKSSRLIFHSACCYVGDTESDLSASLKADIPIYLLSTGQRSKNFLDQLAKKYGTPPVFDNFADALNKVKNELLS